MLKKWDDLPDFMRTEEVRPYYDILNKKRASLVFKRIFDFAAAAVLLVILMPVFALISVVVVLDSPGGVFFVKQRVSRYGKKFNIIKFRTMVKNNENPGNALTVKDDCRITRSGKFLRRTRLDELPQLVNIIMGDMSFCGTRPEDPKYVEKYTPEMYATLLLPAGVTSKTSIMFKDEEKLLCSSQNVDEVYINEILPEKMKYNLASIKEFGFFKEIGVMINTVRAVVR